MDMILPQSVFLLLENALVAKITFEKLPSDTCHEMMDTIRSAKANRGLIGYNEYLVIEKFLFPH